ncbi:hypothetical protein [Jannaschia sp. CCS1]|uniref:hypothetical protein n=1 Tax=Jannaschia sp. (strain CCS1) TaxID=290400 RepID=UPI00030BE8A8|nr:hypothetical protein [Jannaschia sp. CCS1]
MSADLALDLVQWISDLSASVGLNQIMRDDLLPDDDLSSLGISSARLALAAGLDLEPTAQPDLQDRIRQFIDVDPSRIQAAFLMAEDEVSVIHGSDHAVERQTETALDLLAHVTADNTPLASLLETEGLLLLPYPCDTNGCMIIAGSLGLVFLIIAEATTAADAFRWWQSGTPRTP